MALSAAEQQAVLTLINTPAYADLSIGQIWARELDAGNYLCSPSSMYRIARAAGQSRERRALATHPPKVKPELLADGPSQVWTCWIVSPVEDSLLAADFIAEAIDCNGVARTPSTPTAAPR